MQKLASPNDDTLSVVSGGKYDIKTFVTVGGIALAFVPEQSNVKCPNCGRTVLSDMSLLYEEVNGHRVTMFCTQNRLSKFYVDELGNLFHCGYNK